MRRFTLGLAAAAVLMGSAPGTVVAEEELCGFFAMAGAFQSERSARREAKRLDIDYYDLDESDSENAGAGYFVVASGPYQR
jgi:hypothetical protein